MCAFRYEGMKINHCLLARNQEIEWKCSIYIDRNSGSKETNKKRSVSEEQESGDMAIMSELLRVCASRYYASPRNALIFLFSHHQPAVLLFIQPIGST